MLTKKRSLLKRVENEMNLFRWITKIKTGRSAICSIDKKLSLYYELWLMLYLIPTYGLQWPHHVKCVLAIDVGRSMCFTNKLTSVFYRCRSHQFSNVICVKAFTSILIGIGLLLSQFPFPLLLYILNKLFKRILNVELLLGRLSLRLLEHKAGRISPQINKKLENSAVLFRTQNAANFSIFFDFFIIHLSILITK